MAPGPKTLNLLKLIGFYLGLFFMFRVIFFFVFADSDIGLFSADVLKAFWLGSRFDLRVAVYLAVPLALLSLIPWLSWQRSPKHRQNWVIFQSLVSFAIIGIYFVDFGYYGYLNSRLSTSIGQFFLNPLISFQMLWESYPFLAIVAGHLVLTYFCFWVFNNYLFNNFESPNFSWKIKLPKGLALFLLYALCIHGSLGQYPLRWSEAFFSANNFISHLGLNPAHYLWDTYSNPNTSYEEDKVKKYKPAMAAYLNLPSTDDLNFLRSTEPTPHFSQEMNVVYIVMESFAAYKMGAMGNVSGASDTLDELASKGWFFKNFYTPTEGTARSMFCSLTGIPDINADSTSSRNPRVVEQNTLINAFKTHEKYYFIGGSANWGNIRGIYENNIADLKMFEENDFDKPKTDVWGLNDLDLFREAARILNSAPKKPFFAMIQAASFHRPYTIPDDKGDFLWQDISEEDRKKYGWKHEQEFNSFRFSDYALGEFFQRIRDSAFFENTLFIIHGDHGVHHFDAQHLSAGYKKFGLNRFHVPLVMYSPKMSEPKVYQDMVSQVDIMTSLAGLFGIKAEHRSLGRNIFNDPKESFAFSYVYYTRPVTKMLYDQNYLIQTNEKGEVAGLYRYNEDPEKDLSTLEPERFQTMRNILHGFYESSRYLIQNNKKIDYKAGTIPN